MKRKLFCVAGAVLMLVALPVAVALATAPNKGAVYEATASSPFISFEVSANGKLVLHLNARNNLITCGPAPGSITWPSHIKISGGRFSATVHEASPNSNTVTGRFLPGGRVKGTLKQTIRCLLPPNFNSGPVKHRTIPWSATSEPAGKASRYCQDYTHKFPPPHGTFAFSNIIKTHTTCPTVYRAMNAGTFASTAPFGFTTPRWVCKAPGNGSQFPVRCKKGKATFSFDEG